MIGHTPTIRGHHRSGEQRDADGQIHRHAPRTLHPAAAIGLTPNDHPLLLATTTARYELPPPSPARGEGLRPHCRLLLVVHPGGGGRGAGERRGPGPGGLQLRAFARRRGGREGGPSRDAPRVVRFASRGAGRGGETAIPAPPRLPPHRQARGPGGSRRRVRAGPREGGGHHPGGRAAHRLSRQRERDRGGLSPQLRARLGGRFAGVGSLGSGGVRRPLVVALRGPACGLCGPGPRPPVPSQVCRRRGRLARGAGGCIAGHRGARLPAGGRPLAAPEALRQARLRRPPRTPWRALRARRRGRSRKDPELPWRPSSWPWSGSGRS